jgi:predicted PurR-regulated permease PerM
VEAVKNVAAKTAESALGPGARYLLTFASLIVVIAGVRAADAIIIPILLAVFIAVLSLPLLSALQRWGLPRVLAVVATVLADIAILSAVGFLVVRSVDEFTGQLPGYQASLEQATNSVVQWISERGGPIEAGDFLDAERVVDLVGGAVTRVAAVLQNALLVILITVFILSEATALPAKLRLAFGEGGGRFDRWTRTAKDVQHYLGIKTVVGVVKGVLTGFLVAFFDLDFPVFWALSAFFLHYIPSIGAIVAAIPPVLIALVQFGPGSAAGVALGYLAIDTVLGNMIEPTLMGRRFGLSVLVVFMSLLFWGWVWGPVGMLLSVPLTIIVKIILENTEDLRWLAILLGTGPDGTTIRERDTALGAPGRSEQDEDDSQEPQDGV